MTIWPQEDGKSFGMFSNMKRRNAARIEKQMGDMHLFLQFVAASATNTCVLIDLLLTVNMPRLRRYTSPQLAQHAMRRISSGWRVFVLTFAVASNSQ